MSRHRCDLDFRNITDQDWRAVHLATANNPSVQDSRPIRFAEQSRARGLEFYGQVGADVIGPLVPITQVLGCGGGVIDFDHDGKHDLLFTAAGGAIRETDSQSGALFRNVGASFLNVTSQSGFGDGGFGHGITVGDFNDDGFQDVLVLNLGRNRLFRNNGDGTFADATDHLAEQGDGNWSTSGAIVDVDVDGDGYNDLVIVNYCDADQALNERCTGPRGQEINCFPLKFRAGPDQFLRGGSNGRFTDMTSDWVSPISLGRGLGVVAGRLDGRDQCIYVVNDASPNNFYRWRDDPQQSGLVDSGIASGVALDAQSLDQGSMGIATGDFDNDGDLDFYVTGFAAEYNIYYEQRTPGFWSDRTAARGMVDDTLRTVGFGTEAIDLDNDGVLELVVTNGHVGAFGAGKPTYVQPLQVFRRSRDGRFGVVDIKSWGEYFESTHVGRCLFTCDVDSDGRRDVVVTHATERVALLVNRSEPGHHRITFALVDSKHTRDAVGAVVEFELGEGRAATCRKLYRIAGDGYLCSNHQELYAGTGSEKIARDVRLTWPDGYQETIGDPDSDANYVLVREEPPHMLYRYQQQQP